VQKKGFAAYLMPVERSGKTLYRVRVGPPQTSRDKAAKLSDDLRRAGYTGQVTEQVAGR
jgi:cell division septation protein DedD